MKQQLLCAIGGLAIALASGPSAVLADSGPNTEVPPDQDFGVLLSEMLAVMGDALSARQEQAANEAHLGSAAATKRLHAAVLHVPQVTLRFGPRPFFGACLTCDD
jgi:hypothetical protein